MFLAQTRDLLTKSWQFRVAPIHLNAKAKRPTVFIMYTRKCEIIT
jgi:hypothetical protein